MYLHAILKVVIGVEDAEIYSSDNSGRTDF
jgi:hypothetical protein